MEEGLVEKSLVNLGKQIWQHFGEFTFPTCILISNILCTSAHTDFMGTRARHISASSSDARCMVV